MFSANVSVFLTGENSTDVSVGAKHILFICLWLLYIREKEIWMEGKRERERERERGESK